jgi:Domain of unknown function (DUF1788)
LLDHIPKQKHGLRVKHIDLFDFVMDYLKSRKLLDNAIQMQREKGDEAVSGVGSVYPLLRTSSLLTNLQAVMGRTPLVVFSQSDVDGFLTKLRSELEEAITKGERIEIR